MLFWECSFGDWIKRLLYYAAAVGIGFRLWDQFDSLLVAQCPLLVELVTTTRPLVSEIAIVQEQLLDHRIFSLEFF